jgi:hypothetical protein
MAVIRELCLVIRKREKTGRGAGIPEMASATAARENREIV